MTENTPPANAAEPPHRWQTPEDFDAAYPGVSEALDAAGGVLVGYTSGPHGPVYAAASAAGTEPEPGPGSSVGAPDDLAFRNWLRLVDGCLVDLTGHTSDFVPDDPERFTWRKWFSDGLTPEACAAAVVSAQAGDWAERYRIDKSRDNFASRTQANCLQNEIPASITSRRPLMTNAYLIQGISETSIASSDMTLDVFRRNPLRVQLTNGETHTHARRWVLKDESFGPEAVTFVEGRQWWRVGPAGELLVRFEEIIVEAGRENRTERGTAMAYAPGTWTNVTGNSYDEAQTVANAQPKPEGPPRTH